MSISSKIVAEIYEQVFLVSESIIDASVTYEPDYLAFRVEVAGLNWGIDMPLMLQEYKTIGIAGLTARLRKVISDYEGRL